MSKNLSELLNILEDFEKDNWVAPRDKKSVTRHLTQHIGKLLGKLSTVTEKWEHGFDIDESSIREEVIPDLLYYALSLARNYEIDLEQSFLNRLKENRKKVDEWKEQGLVPKDASKTW